MQAKEYLDRGDFVPDDLVVTLVADALRPGSAARQSGVLLDGFPRTADQAAALTRLVEVERVVIVTVPERTLMARAKDRRIDPVTGQIYHLQYVPPPDDDPAVAARLVKRRFDDDPSAFRVRLDTFFGQVRRVLPYFPRNRTVHVDGQRSVQEVQRSVIEAISGNPLYLTSTAAAASAASSSAPVAPSNVAAVVVPTCAVCLDKDATFLCAPCGHQCGCEGCLTSVKRTSGKCPICRQDAAWAIPTRADLRQP